MIDLDKYFLNLTVNIVCKTKGVPGGKVTTCFIARFNEKKGTANLEAANRYFDRCKEDEGVEENGTETENKENTT